MLAGMAKPKDLHRCTDCGATAPRWLGRCTTCDAWGTLEPDPGQGATTAEAVGSGPDPVMLDSVDVSAALPFPTGVDELDRVLDGGLVPGSVTLLGGEPGVGKSTLVLEVLANAGTPRHPALLVCGEESPGQVRGRAERLEIRRDNVLLLADTDVDAVCAHAEAVDASLIVVDSVQTLKSGGCSGSPGTPGQVLASAQALVEFAKRTGRSVVLVGHVTKEGDVAGPRALEHVVDTVLSFEGDRRHALRMLRAHKHRFGGTDEVGCFEMRRGGLVALPDPSTRLLEGRPVGVPGSVAAAVLDGARPLLVEAQALVVPAAAPIARRSGSGVDTARLALVCAVLEQHAGVEFAGWDVFAAVTGGVSVTESGFDLALVLALASAALEVPIEPYTVVVGEVGLAGELRPVPRLEQRLREAAHHGFCSALVPAPVPSDLALAFEAHGLEIVGVGGIAEILHVLETTDTAAA